MLAKISCYTVYIHRTTKLINHKSHHQVISDFARLFYQIAQSVLNTGFMVPKMVAVESGGQVCSQSVIHIQQLPWLAVDRLWPWLELAGQFLSLLVQMGKKPLSPLVGALFLVFTLGSFQSGGVFTGWKALKAC